MWTTGFGHGTQYSATTITIIIIILALSPATTWAQALFTQPAPNALTALVGTTNYTAGQEVQVGWKTGFAYTTLKVWQAVGDGTYFGQTLAERYTQDQTSFTWPAANVVASSNAGALHFELSDASGNCIEGCTTESTDFYVTKSAQSSSTTSSGSAASSISSASSSATQTSSPTSSSDIGAATASSTSGSGIGNLANNAHNHHALAVGLGVGLGVGLPLLALLLLLCFCIPYRRKKRAKNMPRGQQPVVSRPMQQRLRDSDQLPIMGPAPPPPVVFPDGIAQWRPNGAQRLSGGTATSQAESFHGPFPFEAAPSRDFDTESVVSEYEQRSRWGTPTGQRSLSGSVRTVTPNTGGRARLKSIDEHYPPRPSTPPQWPLRS
ncbi:hypothetical protein LTR62_002412 [Meristemomyces frigidus]|uniref:Mid2 domain-containing protein n=1 Tax=Meristemomyces frigidus TaxID=1508187 RepID=A0AAN7TG25_9PEZI|nr:hypothetical protein LTR62_002412 [Meristemomyces frigidus]